MSEPDITDKVSTTAQPDAGSTSTIRPFERSKWTDYGDGIIEYVYTPPKGKGKVQRVCGILGKDKRVSQSRPKTDSSLPLKRS
jgi:hypothetical protein